VSAVATGYVLQGREDFAFGDDPAGSQRANLRDVHGTLELFPPASPPIKQASLMIDLIFKAEQIEGDLRLHFLLSDQPSTGTEYIPLFGHWPSGPTSPVPPAEASPDTSEP
jgi:hypothetical protein